MHYRYEKHPLRSAHLRRRAHPAALTLFGADDSTCGVERDSTSSAAQRIPPFSAFIAAHHRAHESRTLNDGDVPDLVSVSEKILHLLADGVWHLVTEIRDVAGALSYDRRLRDLRKLSVELDGSTYYVHVDARRVADDARLYEYRAHLQPFPQTRTKTHE